MMLAGNNLFESIQEGVTESVIPVSVYDGTFRRQFIDMFIWSYSFWCHIVRGEKFFALTFPPSSSPVFVNPNLHFHQRWTMCYWIVDNMLVITVHFRLYGRIRCGDGWAKNFSSLQLYPSYIHPYNRPDNTPNTFNCIDHGLRNYSRLSRPVDWSWDYPDLLHTARDCWQYIGGCGSIRLHRGLYVRNNCVAIL